MGLNLDIENFEPSSDTKFQDLIDWLNESFQKISTSPIMLECRDEEGNLIWDEDNPIYEGDVVTENFLKSGSSIVNFDETKTVLLDINNEQLDIDNFSNIKINCYIEINNYKISTNSRNDHLSYTVDFFDTKNETVIQTRKYEISNSNIENYSVVVPFIISFQVLDKIKSGVIIPKVRCIFRYYGHINSGSASFDVNTSASVFKPSTYSYKNIAIVNN